MAWTIKKELSVGNILTLVLMVGSGWAALATIETKLGYIGDDVKENKVVIEKIVDRVNAIDRNVAFIRGQLSNFDADPSRAPRIGDAPVPGSYEDGSAPTAGTPGR